MTVMSAKFNQKPLCLSLQELTSNKVQLRVLRLDLWAEPRKVADRSWLTRLKPNGANHFKMLRNIKIYSTMCSLLISTDSVFHFAGCALLVSEAEQVLPLLTLSVKQTGFHLFLLLMLTQLLPKCNRSMCNNQVHYFTAAVSSLSRNVRTIAVISDPNTE